MKINFIGNFTNGPGGEIADQVHLARELTALGHTVQCVPQDIWKAICDGEVNMNWENQLPSQVGVDINIITKWHHFDDEKYITHLQEITKAPVFYWVWDWMDGEDFHMKMARACDLYLSGELGSATFYHNNNVPFYYFQFDSTDRKYLGMSARQDEKKYDVVFLGSHTNQNERLDVLKAINEVIPIQVFAYDFEDWRKDGFKAEPAVYGQEFNRVVAQSNIVLGTSANVDCFGYWSNRVGKVLYTSGFLLQWYTPGMENFLADCCEYFQDSDEAIEKIQYYLKHPEEKEKFIERNIVLGRERWTSLYKARQLTVLMERYKKSEGGTAWMLP